MAVIGPTFFSSPSVCVLGAWTLRYTPLDSKWTSVAYGAGRWVAVSEGQQSGLLTTRLMTSVDGVTWVSEPQSPVKDWQTMVFANGKFVALGKDPTTGVRLSATSTDGLTWTYFVTGFAANEWRSLTYGAGLYVAVARTGGTNSVLTSPDGETWTVRALPSGAYIGSLAYGNATFVAVGSGFGTNYIFTSSSAITWISQTVPVSMTNLNSVVYGNGKFVAISEGHATVSTDGITWSVREPISLTFTFGWFRVAYANGFFFASRYGYTTDNLATSSDGIAWTVTTAPANFSYSALAANEARQVVAVDGLPSTYTANYQVMSNGCI